MRPNGTWQTAGSNWNVSIPGQAPKDQVQAVQASGRVWFLASQSAQDDGSPSKLAVGSFDAARPTATTYTALPTSMIPTTGQTVRLTVVQDRPVVVSTMGGVDSIAAASVSTTAPYKLGHVATEKALPLNDGSPAATDVPFWDSLLPGEVTNFKQGVQRSFDPVSGKWASGLRPKHPGATVLATIGADPASATTVELVGRATAAASRKPGHLYVGSTEVKTSILPAVGTNNMSGPSPTSVVTPVAATPQFALISVQVSNTTATSPRSQLLLVRPHSSTATVVASDRPTDVRVSRSGAVAMVTSTSCIIVSAKGQRVAKAAYGAGDWTIASFDGTTAWLADSSEQPTAASCAAPMKKVATTDHPASSPVLTTDSKATVFPSYAGTSATTLVWQPAEK